ncbi:short-chain dehydrogenase/reductase SDR [Herbaspirillum sp. BH-1]|jgi:short-subunit dehydrogenase|uniref:Short-subunit dehydrogenase n=1 Tax=Herbaspirillum frisingense TaxID=92645 RepID=A0ABU1PGP1_9BURK|nr:MULTISPECIES: SDR family NAD(P)-dependent oxidoreductase [Herbaspirillum]MDR6585113.1 short-subunit dehydrogenase [Herbaspirillum frisingense]PLY60971.1 short-chain dehydrogenase/reductase SDR [Herbaspirillum sp. BH-1]
MVEEIQSTIVITGATSAIGAALAVAYARPGVQLVLHGRNALRLEEVADGARALGAQVELLSFDLRDFATLRDALSRLPVIDLLILNAGINTSTGPDGQAEPWDEVEALLDVNLKSAMVAVHAAYPAMRARGRGQIALISSLAAYFGLPVTPAYSASKAGLKAYGEALRGWLMPYGIKVSVIMPGYVKSAMCDDMPGPKPFLWTPQRAAASIRSGLQANRARISFPFPLNLGTWFLAVLPAGLSTRIVRWMGYGH